MNLEAILITVSALIVLFMLSWWYFRHREWWRDLVRHYASSSIGRQAQSWVAGGVMDSARGARAMRNAQVGIAPGGLCIIRNPLLYRWRLDRPLFIPWSDLFLGRRKRQLAGKMELVPKACPQQCILVPGNLRLLVGSRVMPM